jgi:hypothetical protein
MNGRTRLAESMPMVEDDAQRSWHLKQLRSSLRRLSTAGADQPVLFPDSAAKPDELAFEFDHWSSLVRALYGEDLSRIQSDALAAIHAKFETMSSDDAEFDVELWTEAAVIGSEQWADIRALAASALEAFGWPGGEDLPRNPNDQAA